MVVGGPAPGTPRPVPGTVRIRGPRGRITITVGADGSFSSAVPAGAYDLTGTSPELEQGAMICRSAHPAEVTRGNTTSVDIACNVP